MRGRNALDLIAMTHMRRPGTVAALVLLGVAVRVVVAAQGWFYWDDLILLAQARETPLGELLLRSHDGHLMPGSWLLIWLFATLVDGLNWPAALTALAAGQLLAAGAVAYAAWRICPRQAWWVTGLYVLAPVTLPVTTWLAAAVNSLPLHAACAVWLAHGWLYLRRGRPADAVIAAVAVLAAGFFSERVIFLAPFTVLLLLAWGPATRWLRLTAALVVPAAGWAIAYLATVGDPRVSEGGGELFVQGYLRAFLPTLVGGPWDWERWHPGPPFATPPGAAIVLGVLAAVALLGWSIWRRHAAPLLVLAYPLLPFLALAVARSGPDTAAEITQTLRHFAEVAVLMALTAGVLAAQNPRPPRWTPVLGVVLAASSLFSTVTYAQAWAEQPAREYFAALRASFDGREEPILDQAVPLEVLLPVAHPYNRLSALLGPPQISDSTSAPALVDGSGGLVDAELYPMRATGAECGPGTFALDGPLMERDWVLRLNYFAEDDGEIAVALDGEAVTVPVEAGLHQVHVALTGGGQELRVEGEVCLGRSEVGVLAPAR